VTLVDTNVLIDVLSNDPHWQSWSIDMLTRRFDLGALIVTDVTYSELAPRFGSSRSLDGTMIELNVELQRIPREALFIAGGTFARYRSHGGVRSTVVADFFIGAHAQVLGCPLLTRDIRRYRRYFPGVALIAPDA
jgi:hypothetical protein